MPSTMLLRPAVFDADHNDRSHVWIGPGTDQRAEVQIKVLPELQPAVGVRQRHGACNVVRHGLTSRIRKVIDRQDNDVIANTDASILASIS